MGKGGSGAPGKPADSTWMSSNVTLRTSGVPLRALGLPEDNVEQDVDRLFKKYGSVMITEAMNDLEIVMMTLHARPREFNVNLEG